MYIKKEYSACRNDPEQFLPLSHVKRCAGNMLIVNFTIKIVDFLLINSTIKQFSFYYEFSITYITL